MVDNYVDVAVGVLSKIRKDLNGKTISTKDQKLVAEITQTNAVAESKPKEKLKFRWLGINEKFNRLWFIR